MWRKKWVRLAALAVAIPTVVLCFAAAYSYVRFAHLIDARLHGERETVFPRILARPLELRRGQSLTERQLIDRLNDLGYAHRDHVEKPGEFAIGNGAVAIMPRAPELKRQVVRVVFQRPAPEVKNASRRQPPPKPADRVQRLELGTKPSERLMLDAPVLTALNGGEREKRRPVALAAIPERMQQAVLSIEDRRFYEHPGVDPIGILGAALSNLRGRHGYTSGGSTITQQVARNVFLPKMFPGMTLKDAREKSVRRKLVEAWVSLIITARASKDEILEMYLNDMTLGQRGSFGIVGVAEASRLFFAKDISNVTLAEAATIAGVFQSPSALSPFTNPDRCKEKRNVVLQAMVDAGYVEHDVADRAMHEPLTVVQRALEAEAPYFVDFVGQTLDDHYPGLTTTTTEAVDVYTTLDLHLQRLAQDAVRDGLVHVDELLPKRKRGKAEAALIAVDPRTGEILAFVGGRSYNPSQYNRAVVSRRQPGSVFKPFVYLTAFEEAAKSGRFDVTPASITNDAQETFEFDDQVWTPENYEHEYDGPITFRRALAHSRNLGTIHVAQSRDDCRGAVGRLRQRRRVLEETRRRERAEAVSVDCARRVRSDAVRDRHGLHAVSERRRDPPAETDPAGRPRRQGRDEKGSEHASPCRAARHDVPRHQHDAQRAQRRDRRVGAVDGLHARRRRQDRHYQRSARRLVRRLHAGTADGGLGRLRRQHARRPQRRARRAANLDTVHAHGARRPHQRLVRSPRRHHLHGHRRRDWQARRPALPQGDQRSVPLRHRTARGLRSASIGRAAYPA